MMLNLVALVLLLSTAAGADHAPRFSTSICQAQLEALASSRNPAGTNAFQWDNILQKWRDVQTELDQWHKDHQSTDIEGNTGGAPVQQQFYLALAQIPCVRRVCEIGFNAGHSAAVWMAARPDIHLISFDIGSHPYAFTALQFYATKYPGRVTMTFGDSTQTVPQLAHTVHHMCDILIVDGGHDYATAIKDVVNMAHLANPQFNIFLIDDVNCDAEYCKGPDQALQQAVDEQLVKVSMRYAQGQDGVEVPWERSKRPAGIPEVPRGFTFGSYNVNHSSLRRAHINAAASLHGFEHGKPARRLRHRRA